MCAQQKCAEPRANIKKRRRHNSSTSAETVWSSRYGCGLSCRHGGESGETCKQYQCAAKDRASAASARRGYLSPENIPALEAGAVASRVPFSNFWTIALGPLSQDFLGNLFLRSSGFPGRPPGGAGPSSRLCGARAGGPFFRFFGSRSGPLSHFFGLPDALREASHSFSADAPSHQFAYARRAGGAYHQSRRGRAHAQAQVVLPVSPSRKPLFPSRYRPTGLCLRSGQEQPDRRAQLRRLGSYRLPFWQQSLLVRLARDR